VYTGMGAVWENPTRSIPVGNLMDMDSVWHSHNYLNK
jgi:hypothetical protein